MEGDLCMEGLRDAAVAVIRDFPMESDPSEGPSLISESFVPNVTGDEISGIRPLLIVIRAGGVLDRDDVKGGGMSDTSGVVAAVAFIGVLGVGVGVEAGARARVGLVGGEGTQASGVGLHDADDEA